MKVSNCVGGGGTPTPMAKGKRLLGPNSKERDKNLLHGGVGTLCKVLEAYMGKRLCQPIMPAIE